MFKLLISTTLFLAPMVLANFYECFTCAIEYNYNVNMKSFEEVCGPECVSRIGNAPGFPPFQTLVKISGLCSN